MYTRICKYFVLVPILAAATVLAVAAGPSPRVHAGGNLPVVTFSAIDITGTTIQMSVVVPNRDTGTPAMFSLPLPPGALPPEYDTPLRALLGGPAFSTPLSTQFDQYWTTPDPLTNKSPRDQACDEGKAYLQDNVNDPGPAQHISCSLASTSKLYAQLVGSSLYLSFQLGPNTIDFTMSTDCGSPPLVGCLPDPKLTAHFSIEILTVMHLADICSLSASDGTVYLHAVNIDQHNLSGDLLRIFGGGKFVAAEVALQDTVKQKPLPLDGFLKSIRDACSDKTKPAGKVLAGFRGFEPSLDAQGIAFKVIHPAIDVPVLRNGDQVIAPSFFRPMLTTTQPAVGPGKTLQLSGQYFQFSNPLLGFVQPTGPVCPGGGTELESGPAGGQTQRQTLSADADGNCPISFDGANLSPSTAYQFRARNCDVVTCSTWSPLFNASTAAGVSNSVKLTMDGAQLGTATIDSKGTFSATVTIPAGTAAGTRLIHASAGDAQADASIQVTGPAAAGGGGGTLVMVGVLQGETGCPPHPLTSTATDASFLLYGTGFAPGTVTITLDSLSGMAVGTATAGADGTFCATMKGVPGSQAGQHKLVAVQNGTVQAEDTVTFVTPGGVH